jgi:excinuclease ABC subunit A
MGEMISFRSVKTHNLRGIDVDFPLYKWTSVTGVSGSGKSSLVFNTIYAESQRRFLETLGAYERQFLQGIPSGDFDSVNQIPASIALKQSNKSTDPRSTIGSVSDLVEPLRRLFASIMDPSCVTCGNLVESQSTEDVREYLENHKTTVAQWVLGTRMLPERPTSALKKMLMAEGYDRLFTSKIVSIDELDELVKSDVPLYLLMDRIPSQMESEELENRVEAVWSTLRFSDKYGELLLAPLDKMEVNLARAKTFKVQPFCGVCNTKTQIVKPSDFDSQSVLGACEKCTGIGVIQVPSLSKIVPHPHLSLREQALALFQSESVQWLYGALESTFLKSKRSSDLDTPYQDLPQEVKDFIWWGKDPQGLFKIHPDFMSVQSYLDMLAKEKYKQGSRVRLAKYCSYVTCSHCNGTRLKKAGQVARCLGLTFSELCYSEIQKTLDWVSKLRGHVTLGNRVESIKELWEEVTLKLSYLNRLGLGSHSLWRRARTLSGGEFQRVLLARVLGSGLTDSLYVLDEPSVGLGKGEIEELIGCLKELQSRGNTILMVEHDKNLVSAGDHWIELGPGGGAKGGTIINVASGANFETHKPKCMNVASDFLASKLPKNPVELFPEFNPKSRSVYLKGFHFLNCKNISVEIPLGAITLIGGPSGSGKSSLLSAGLEAALEKGELGIYSSQEPDLDELVGTWENFYLPDDFYKEYEVVTLSQRAGQKSISSVPVTILGVFTPIRELYARTEAASDMDLSSSHFSFNGLGACAKCGGNGVVKEDLFYLGESEKTCPQCNGTRYQSFIDQCVWNGLNIVQILSKTIDQALEVFSSKPAILKPLRVAQSLGLGYLPLGCASSSLSGGEIQRLRMAALLSGSKKKMFCICDEPSRGLSDADIVNLTKMFFTLSKEGHTFVLAEHHELFDILCHQKISLGPKSGVQGGRIVERQCVYS